MDNRDHRRKQQTAVLEQNSFFVKALELMQGDAPYVFITGRAGTGKSTLLKYFRENTQTFCVYLAPTGVAALNINGETIHSFFGFSPGITVDKAKRKGASADKKLLEALDAIVLDEVSMVRADLLDCVDVYLRAALRSKRPFGGKKLIFIGDLYQLPPVVLSHEKEAFSQRYETPYFFSSDVMKVLLLEQQIAFIELEKVYRQNDSVFIAMLNGVRNRSITDEQIDYLNQRVQPKLLNDRECVIWLTPTNQASDEINQHYLLELKDPEHSFEGEIKGDFPVKDLPTDLTLLLKRGSRVMFLNNDPQGRWVNGTLGTINVLSKEGATVKIDDMDEPVEVEPFTWSMYKSVYNQQAKQLDQEKLGSFTQLPLRLAWATTIHKSQGKTFDRCIIDLGKGAFASGQVYVALSRCRTLQGIRLIKPVTKRQLFLDWRVMKFQTSLQYRLSNQEQAYAEKVQMIEEAIQHDDKVRILYLKGKDEKSLREIIPYSIEQAEYNGHPFMALQAFCCLRNEDRVFNLERILKVEKV